MCFGFSVIVIGFKFRSIPEKWFTGMDHFYKNNCINCCSDQKVVGPLQHQKKETVIIIKIKSHENIFCTSRDKV